MFRLNEIQDRFDIKAFDLPEEYMEDSEKADIESKLMLCKLFIECFKVLTYEEFNAFQGVLLLEECWDKRPNESVHIGGGMFRTFDEVPLNLNIISRLLDTDKFKMVALIKKAFKKLPILKTFLSESLVKEFEQFKNDELEESSQFKLEQEKFTEIGNIIRKSITRKFEKTFQYSCDYSRSK